MKDIALERTKEQIKTADEESATDFELTAEEVAEDRLADLLLRAWTDLLKEEQKL